MIRNESMNNLLRFKYTNNEQDDSGVKFDQLFDSTFKERIKSKEEWQTYEGDLSYFDFEQAQNIYEIFEHVKDDQSKKDEFEKLFQLMSGISCSNFEKNGDENTSAIRFKDGVLTLRINNIGGSGLNLAFTENNSFTIVDDDSITEHQFYTFAKFFEENGLEIGDYNDFQNISIVNDEGKSIGSFEELHKKYLDNSVYEGRTLEDLQQELASKEGYEEWLENNDKLDELLSKLDNDPNNPTLKKEINELRKKLDCFHPALQRAIELKSLDDKFDNSDDISHDDENDDTKDTPSDDYDGSDRTDDGLGSGDNNFSEYLKEGPKVPSIYAAQKALIARSGIMRIDKKCLKRKRMPDGSYVLAFYDSESDLRADGKIDPKTGLAKDTTKVAFRFYDSKPPRVGIYVPQGKKFETAYAKGALKALKEQGYNYFVMPNAVEFGGDGQGAFWEAAGDQLVCPRLKRGPNDKKGCDMGNDHLTKLLKAISDKNDGNEDDKWLYKMRLVEEINAYQSWQKKPNTALLESAKALTGDIKFHQWSSSILPDLDRKIQNGIDKEGWNAIDISCAYVAQKKIAEAIHNGVLSYKDESGKEVRVKFDYLNYDPAAIDAMFKAEMKAAEAGVIKEFKSRCKPGCTDTPDESDDGTTPIDDDDRDQGKALQQRDFENASRNIVNFYRSSTESTFKSICAKYPGAEYAKEWRVKTVSAPKSIRMGEKGSEFTYAHGRANKSSSSKPTSRGGR